MSELKTLISIQNANKRFEVSGQAAITALQDVNLDIFSGEFVSLIGPSGCGKSTLLRLIADLIPPTSGTLTVNGKSPSAARQAREYGFVFQAPTLYEWRTVRQNVELPLEVMNIRKEERRDRAQEMLELVELGGFGDYYPWQLSGGMQQRASIARALSFAPRILLMDEPFGALDEFTRDRMNLQLLKIWERTKTTIVFVTHSIAEAVFLSNRVVVMSARPGRLKKVISIDLPTPRVFETREEMAYYTAVTEVRESLREAFLTEV